MHFACHFGFAVNDGHDSKETIPACNIKKLQPTVARNAEAGDSKNAETVNGRNRCNWQQHLTEEA
jgi:hypothetical protein